MVIEPNLNHKFVHQQKKSIYRYKNLRSNLRLEELPSNLNFASAGSNTMVNGQLNGPNSPSQQLGAVPGTAYMTAVLGYEGDEPEREIYIHKNTHTYIHLHIRLHNLDTLIHICINTNIHIYLYIFVYTRSHFGSRVKYRAGCKP